MNRAITLALLSAGLLYASAGAAAPTCSVEIHPRFNLYVISVNGMPFKNKHYVDYDDAALLHKVLVDSGHCVAAQKVARCDQGGKSGKDKIVRLAGGANTKANARSSDPAALGWSSTACSDQ